MEIKTKSKEIIEKCIKNLPKTDIKITNNLVAQLGLIAKKYEQDIELQEKFIDIIEILTNLQITSEK